MTTIQKEPKLAKNKNLCLTTSCVCGGPCEDEEAEGPVAKDEGGGDGGQEPVVGNPYQPEGGTMDITCLIYDKARNMHLNHLSF